MLIKIDFNSEIPIYQQLKNQIIIGIATNKLKVNDTLPSVRKMASDIGINLHTVRKVYNQLKTEGYLISNRKKGAIIAKMPILFNEKTNTELINTFNLMIATAKCNGLSDKNILKLTKDILITLEKGESYE